MDPLKSTITLTFGECAENHVGMEKLGAVGSVGFSIDDLLSFQTKFPDAAELYWLHSDDLPPAAVLVIRGGVDAILGANSTSALFAEQAALDVDKKAFMYGRVVDKHARWNLCFDEVGHDPDYAVGKGRVVPFSAVPITSHLADALPTLFGPKAVDLKCEANYYYDVSKCGIGFHGDSERRKVIGVRLGVSMDLYYQWYKDGEPVGERHFITLNGGDVYIMSEKAVGTDWKQKKIYTLRHAAGCSKFTTV